MAGDTAPREGFATLTQQWYLLNAVQQRVGGTVHQQVGEPDMLALVLGDVEVVSPLLDGLYDVWEARADGLRLVATDLSADQVVERLDA